MARILERRAAQLAVTSLPTDRDLETFRLVYGHLYKAVGGVEPSVGMCPLDASAA